MSEIKTLIAQLPFFAGLPGDEIFHILSRATSIETYIAGDTILAQNQPCTHMAILLEGNAHWERQIASSRGHAITMGYDVSPVSPLGQFAVLYNRPYPRSVEAVSTCRCLLIQVKAMDRLLYRFPDMRSKLAPLDIISHLRTMPWLAPLSLVDISLLALETKEERYASQTDIYTTAHPAADIFFVKQGQINLVNTRETQESAFLGNGAAFGVQAALGHVGYYRNVAMANCPTTVYRMPARLLSNLAPYMEEMNGGDPRHQREAQLRNLNLFQDLSDDSIRRLAGFTSHFVVPHHHLIALQGEAADSLWMLMPQGSATLHGLEKGEALPEQQVEGPLHFGEAALLLEQPIASTIEAMPASQWMRLHRQDFLAFVQGEESQNIKINELLRPSPNTERLRGGLGEREQYSWLEADEALVMIRQRHWIVLARKLVTPFLLSLLFGILLWVGWQPAIDANWKMAGVLIAGIIVVVVVVWDVIDYLNDYLLITSQRVVQQEKVIFVSERRRAAPLNQLQNVDVDMGLVGNLLGFGDLVVHTASTDGDIVFDYAPNPAAMREAIFQQRQLREESFRAKNKMEIQITLEARLGLRQEFPERVLTRDTPAKSGPAPRGWWSWFWFQVRQLWELGPPEEWSEVNRIVWRKHWMILAVKITAPATLLLLAILTSITGFLGIIRAFAPAFGAIELLASLVGLLAFLWFLWEFADWRNDTYQVTRSSIVDVEKKPLFFAEKRREARLQDIQDIELEIPTPLHYLLNVGNVRIRTAAAEGLLTFDFVPDPRSVSEEIRRRIEDWRRQEERRQAKQQSDELPDWFEIYRRLDSKEGYEEGNLLEK